MTQNTLTDYQREHLTITQQRVIEVLNRIADMVVNDEDDAGMFVDGLNFMLDEIHSNDGFGTEGQCDPRGDFRNGQWSMMKVEGIDD